MSKRKYYRLDAETALKERCWRMTIEIMKTMPCNTYRPAKVANDMHEWIKGYFKGNLEELTLDPVEAARQKYAIKEEEDYDHLL